MFLSGLLKILFPARCVFCLEITCKPETGICGDCLKSIPYTGEDCFQTGDYFKSCISPLYYKDSAREAVLRFKFKGKTNYADAFGKLMADCVRQHYGSNFDLISWTPLSRQRYQQRGYSQTKLLAKSIAANLGVAARELLEKPGDTPAQSSLKSADERRLNVAGVYCPIKPELVPGSRVLLVDDVITTGSTLSECAKVLSECGAKSVLCCTLCKGG